MQGCRITAEQIQLAKKGDGGIRVRLARVRETGTEIQYGIALHAKCRPQRAQIDKLEYIAGGGEGARYRSKTVRGDKLQSAILDDGLIATPDSGLFRKSSLNPVVIKTPVNQRQKTFRRKPR